MIYLNPTLFITKPWYLIKNDLVILNQPVLYKPCYFSTFSLFVYIDLNRDECLTDGIVTEKRALIHTLVSILWAQKWLCCYSKLFSILFMKYKDRFLVGSWFEVYIIFRWIITIQMGIYFRSFKSYPFEYVIFLTLLAKMAILLLIQALHFGHFLKQIWLF